MNSNHTFLVVISLDSALKKDRKYHPLVFLKECKYIEKKVVRHIIDDINSSSDDFDDSDEEWIEDMKLMCLESFLFFVGAILKVYSGCMSSQGCSSIQFPLRKFY